MLRSVFISILLLFLACSCASPPRQELETAQAALAQAYAAGAKDLAPQEYKAGAAALKDAEYLISRGKYGQAREILPLAASHAFRAKFKAWEERAKQEQEIQRQQLREEEERQKALEQEKLAKVKAPPKKPTPPPPPPKPVQVKPKPQLPPPPPITKYEVRDGETLSTISARPEVYDDPLLWPILYKANRDQIKDPRQIYPGQTLTIPRDTPEVEKEEARTKARELKIFALPSSP